MKQISSTMNAKKITIEIPQYWEVTAADYHEFSRMAHMYINIDIPVFFEEVGCDGRYRAVFWVSKKPTKFINSLKEQYNNYN